MNRKAFLKKVGASNSPSIPKKTQQNARREVLKDKKKFRKEISEILSDIEHWSSYSWETSSDEESLDDENSILESSSVSHSSNSFENMDIETMRFSVHEDSIRRDFSKSDVQDKASTPKPALDHRAHPSHLNFAAERPEQAIIAPETLLPISEESEESDLSKTITNSKITLKGKRRKVFNNHASALAEKETKPEHKTLNTPNAVPIENANLNIIHADDVRAQIAFPQDPSSSSTSSSAYPCTNLFPGSDVHICLLFDSRKKFGFKRRAFYKFNSKKRNHYPYVEYYTPFRKGLKKLASKKTMKPVLSSYHVLPNKNAHLINFNMNSCLCFTKHSYNGPAKNFVKIHY